MANLASIFLSVIQLVVPQPCFDEFFVSYNFFNVPCLKIVLSKCLGYGIIAMSVLVKVPQISKISRAGSAEGISIVSTSMELAAITGSFVYAYARQFPFSAYGESIFLVIQTAVIAFLVLSYSRGSLSALAYIGFYAAILAFLLSPSAPMNLLWTLQAAVMPLIASARIIQAYTNYKNQSTGQLSAVTVLLIFAGGLARIFTSVQETGDPTIIATYVVSSACSGLLAFQIYYYWKSAKAETAGGQSDRQQAKKKVA